ncbi:ribosome small subunit-dependent GTPase A [Paenibacillus xerothermodurans]|uniref:Small ribosomal subunit biogenesis GTPase RsgA n=1 Tax=Paenibacillus xerothermodurans TaxID=1977292 RepID=A0A2W1NCS5_PAEXE|nr:ribosome small subunit-dependent GTPase A [Paenibacillus xerothermodurans]PZE22519.1 ribosome small subunit-dependent GTPase A [Paenibacillus xerothermodurans]
MPVGLITKALSGYYYVLPDGDVNRQLVQCRARGIFKKRGESPLVGDRVMYELTENGEGTVDAILPRSSELIRPPIANVQLVVLVFAVQEPALNLQLLDKFLVHAESAGLDVLICLTKRDLDGAAQDDKTTHEQQTVGPEQAEASADSDTAGDKAGINSVVQQYESIGYPVVLTSAKLGIGIDAVLERLAGHISVFAGQSGVGKSSLLNAMVPGLQLETNQISMKLGRGKHTTRHVELIRLQNGSFVADTPGFSQLDFAQIEEPEELSACFREFQPFAAACKFRGCLHQHEPGCKVIEATESGKIAASRYNHYLHFLVEIKERKRRY